MKNENLFSNFCQNHDREGINLDWEDFRENPLISIFIIVYLFDILFDK